jgi:hypothetical protein
MIALKYRQIHKQDKAVDSCLLGVLLYERTLEDTENLSTASTSDLQGFKSLPAVG